MNLARFTLRRILESIPLLFGLVTSVFFLSRLLPGDATVVFLSPRISPSAIEQVRRDFGLDQPLVDQYVHWLRQALSGNFGFSFGNNAPVLEVIASVFPNTLLLAFSALVLEICFGIALAAFIVRFEQGKLERFVSHILLMLYTVPSFWIALMLLLLFSYGLGWLPSSQLSSSGASDEGSLVDIARHLVLPACTLAIPAAAGFARYLRNSVRSVMIQDYVLAARTMGVPNSTIFRAYILPNAVSPVISLIGIEIGILLTGVLVTETIFALPGMGRLTLQAILSRDYPLILGCTVVAGVVVIIGNFLADLINAAIDPRVRSFAR